MIATPTPPRARGPEPFGLFTHVIIITTLAIALSWVFGYLGGVSTDRDSARYFNLHPLLMFFAFAFAMAEAVLMYRTAPVAHDTQKVLHAALQASAVALAIASVVVLKRWKDHMSFAHWYSVHSWMGLITLSLVSLQWLFGVTIFFSPGGTRSTRRSFAPLHRASGVMIVSMAFLTMISGIMNQQRLLPTHSSPAYYGNVVGLFLVFTYLLLLWNLLSVPDTLYGMAVEGGVVPSVYGAADAPVASVGPTLTAVGSDVPPTGLPARMTVPVTTAQSIALPSQPHAQRQQAVVLPAGVAV